MVQYFNNLKQLIANPNLKNDMQLEYMGLPHLFATSGLNYIQKQQIKQAYI